MPLISILIWLDLQNWTGHPAQHCQRCELLGGDAVLGVGPGCEARGTAGKRQKGRIYDCQDLWHFTKGLPSGPSQSV